jgi:hypothetical protein
VKHAGILLLTFAAAGTAFGHCDTLDGPVVQAARTALAVNDVNVVLPWVQKDDEPSIRERFARAAAVRKLGTEARELADTWFFESVVRLHRLGEGAPYEGVRPSGMPLPPAVRIIDEAVRTGELRNPEHFPSGSRDELRTRLARLVKLKTYDPSDVPAGRRYVAAYVDLVHFAERVAQGVPADGAHSQQHTH